MQPHQSTNILIPTKMSKDFVNGDNLPYFVFSRNYNKYYFFDNVLFSDLDVLHGITELAKAAKDAYVHYFRFDDVNGEKLVFVDDLIDFISRDEERRADDLIFTGGWIFSENDTWAAFQKIPVGLGVVGITKDINIDENLLDKDVFFSIDNSSKESLSNLIENYGNDYVSILLQSYAS